MSRRSCECSSSPSSEDSFLALSPPPKRKSFTLASPTPGTVPVAKPTFTFGATDVCLKDNPQRFAKVTASPTKSAVCTLSTARQVVVPATSQGNVTITIQGGKATKKNRKGRMCPTCGELETKQCSLCQHQHGRHIPWYAEPARVCWGCYRRFSSPTAMENHLQHSTCKSGEGHFQNAVQVWAPMIQALFLEIAQALEVSGPAALIPLVVQQHHNLIPDARRSPILEVDQAVYWLFEMHCQTWPSTGRQYGYDPPTCIITLLNWQILSGLLSLLPLPKQSSIMNVGPPRAAPAGHAVTASAPQQSPSKLKSAPVPAAPGVPSIPTTIPSLLSLRNSLASPAVRSRFTGSSGSASACVADLSPVPKAVDAARYTPILLGADAHFHAPELVKRSGSPTLAAAIKLHPPPQQFQLDLLVPSFCFPTQWPMSGAGLPQEAHHYAVGWHPTSTQHVSPTALSQFEAALQIPGVCALGEVGLDYDRAPNAETCEAQKSLLVEMCILAHKYALPIVVHCRDKEDTMSSAAADDCMEIMSTILSRDHSIYLHCFNQGLEVFVRWLQHFPEVRVGISPLAMTDRCHPGLRGVVQNVLSDMSPAIIYLRGPRHLGYDSVGTPSLIYHLAKEVSRWRGTTLGGTLLQARRATKLFYRLT